MFKPQTKTTYRIYLIETGSLSAFYHDTEEDARKAQREATNYLGESVSHLYGVVRETTNYEVL